MNHMLKKQLFIGLSKPEASKFNSVRNHFFVKPFGGFWTSTYVPDTGGSGWTEWCIAEDFLNPEKMRHFLLTPPENARIYTIDSYDDLERLMNTYKQSTPDAPGFPDFLRMSYPDFEKLSRDYDGIRLTEEGQWRTRNTHPYSLYGWDCESTLWLNWVFEAEEIIEAKEFIPPTDHFAKIIPLSSIESLPEKAFLQHYMKKNNYHIKEDYSLNKKNEVIELLTHASSVAANWADESEKEEFEQLFGLTLKEGTVVHLSKEMRKKIKEEFSKGLFNTYKTYTYFRHMPDEDTWFIWDKRLEC